MDTNSSLYISEVRVSANATDIPPLKPPQVITVMVLGIKFRLSFINEIGIPTEINLASNTTKTAITPSRTKL